MRKGLFASTMIALAFAVAPLKVNADIRFLENDLSGIFPYAGMRWNPEMMEMMGGFSYTIESKASIGFEYIKPVADTVFGKLASVPDAKMLSMNPYLALEFLEPGNQSNLSFGFKVGLLYETSQENKERVYDSYERLVYQGGPTFGYRIVLNEKSSLHLSAAYQFGFAKVFAEYDTVFALRMKAIENNNKRINDPSIVIDQNAFIPKGKLDKTVILHDIPLSIPYLYSFNEFNGIGIIPTVTLLYGDYRSKKAFDFNVTLTLGYMRKF